MSKRYDSGDTGLDQATFSVDRGEFVFLVGSTGSGKSTVMRLLIKELDATEGTIRVAGKELSEITRKRIPFYRRNIGVVFQDFKLLPNRTVYDNVAYALQVTGGKRSEIRDKVPDILRLTGLSTKLHNYPDQLSGGEQQRVSIARAFVNHPPLLLADEPTGNLDPETSIDIMRLLYRINRPARRSWSRRTIGRWSTRCAAACSSSRGGGSSATRRPVCTRATRRRVSSPNGCGPRRAGRTGCRSR